MQLWEQHRDLDFWWPDEPEALPDHIVTLTVFKAKTQYERLKQTVKALRQAPVVSPRLYEFVLDDRQSFGGWIMLHIDGRFHFICERDKLHEEASARRNIVLALNAEWDVKRHRRLGLAARAKALMLSDAYPHMVAFANQPYKHERANAAKYKARSECKKPGGKSFKTKTCKAHPTQRPRRATSSHCGAQAG